MKCLKVDIRCWWCLGRAECSWLLAGVHTCLPSPAGMTVVLPRWGPGDTEDTEEAEMGPGRICEGAGTGQWRLSLCSYQGGSAAG